MMSARVPGSKPTVSLVALTLASLPKTLACAPLFSTPLTRTPFAFQPSENWLP
jgi:hypothetical protein